MAPNDHDDLKLYADLLDLEIDAESLGAPDPNLRSRLLATLNPASRFAGFERRLGEFLDLDGARIRELLDTTGSPAGEAWTDDAVSGVRLYHFAAGPKLAALHCGLVHIDAGITYPRHRHRGEEWVFVLQGSAVDDSGAQLAPGDLLCSEPTSEHSFRTLGPEPFIFVLTLAAQNEIL